MVAAKRLVNHRKDKRMPNVIPGILSCLKRFGIHMSINSKLLLELIKYFAAGLFVLLSGKKGEKWIIAERGVDARDNSFHLFRYIRENHPEIDITYVIDGNSPDADKVKALGKIVQYRSLHHYLLFCRARVKISTHIMGFSPDSGIYQRFDRWGLVHGFKVFLQHGIIKDDIKGIHYPLIKPSLFVCGAQLEFEFIRDTYEFPEGIVHYLGLPRFDALMNHCPQKMILVMPTWRMWLGNYSNSLEFKMTEYYKRYESLLNNPEMARMAKEYGYTIIFYPHFEFQKYIDAFCVDVPGIIIARFKDYDVQSLLKDAALLITDYSSIFFDFAYMGKPTVYYQFDYQEFRSHHYETGYFDYVRDAFGPVLRQEDEVVAEVKRNLENNCKMEPEYERRVRRFFPLKDRDNSKRVYQAILKLEEKTI